MEGRFEFKEEALQIMLSAEQRGKALTPKAFVYYAKEFFYIIKNGIKLKNGRSFTLSDDELFSCIEKILDENQGKLGCDISSQLMNVYRIVNETIWRHIAQAEAEEIIDKLRTDESYARVFFFGKDPNGCNIHSLCWNIVYQISKIYHIKINPNDVCTIVYRTLWDEGRWSLLESYAGKSTFFAWLSKVAMNAVIDDLENQHLIRVNRCKTSANTRLKFKSQDPEVCRFLIEDVLPEGSWSRGILIEYYVDKLSAKEIAKERGMTDYEFKKTLTEAESQLKSALIDSELSIADDVVRDKKHELVTVSSDFVMDFVGWLDDQCDDIPFKDVFDIGMGEKERSAEALRILNLIRDNAQFTDDERYVWQKRFMEGESPVDLAKSLDRPRSWVDNIYHRARVKFTEVAKEWWKNVSDYKKIDY